MHSSKNLAYVRLGGHFVYLGTYGSPESKLAYERGDRMAGARALSPEY